MLKSYSVVKEFPGLEIGDIITEQEGTGFYINHTEETSEENGTTNIFANSIAINEAAVLANVGEYFVEVLDDEKEAPLSPVQIKTNDMMQVAGLLESDLVMATSEYHVKVLQDAIAAIYNEVELLNSVQ